ncbi:UNVERIFIED_CONTAM: Mitotic checkpoint protein BUB3.3 [Sesamum radiatum]|uniref:Mitotic checkpoint protein BUB3.3 n=1 Tax=Sesamum radiatum TaxID=300843 RepID=A0AAW2S0B2_SESRA
MDATCLNFNKPIKDAISRIRFAPRSNNLLISSWDSWLFHIIEQSLRLYDVDKCELRLETPSEGAALLDCCFESESIALSANSDGSILRYDMHLGSSEAIGNHDDVATCVEYCEETGQVITAGWDKKVKFWDARSGSSFGCSSNLDVEVESVSISGLNLMVAHRSSVHMYDLRYGLAQAKEFFMDINIKCVRSNSDLEGFVVGSTDGRVALEYLGNIAPALPENAVLTMCVFSRHAILKDSFKSCTSADMLSDAIQRTRMDDITSLQ